MPGARTTSERAWHGEWPGRAGTGTRRSPTARFAPASDHYTPVSRRAYALSPGMRGFGEARAVARTQTWRDRQSTAAGVKTHNGRQPVGTGPALIHNDGERSQVMQRWQSRRGVLSGTIDPRSMSAFLPVARGNVTPGTKQGREGVLHTSHSTMSMRLPGPMHRSALTASARGCCMVKGTRRQRGVMFR